ncbi:hypothetical protein ACWGR4_24050 [Embleya sp. NPDC055664]
MRNSLARAFTWVLRLLAPAPRVRRGSWAERSPRPFEPATPKPAARCGGWRDFVPPGPAGDEPPVQDSATVVPPYLMTPGELAARRRRFADSGTDDARARPAHDWAVAARAAGVMA